VCEFIDVNGNNILVKEKDLARAKKKLQNSGFIIKEK